MTLEGVLGPNDRLERAPGRSVDDPAALCVAADGALLYGSGCAVHRLGGWDRPAEPWAVFDRPVAALCASPGDLVCIGLSGGRVEVRDLAGRPAAGWTSPEGLAAVDDCTFLSEREIAVIDGGCPRGEDILAVAPWEDTGRGRVVAFGPGAGQRTLAEGLHFPAGICLDGSGRPIVTLIERGAVADLSGGPRRSGYPAYPGRLRKTAAGYVMACLSRRDPLIEFLKTEPAFVAEMKAGMAPRHWISPRREPSFSHDFPIELGATRLFGEIKPWAPSFSYGLVIELGEDLMPVASAHSRANGRRHAIVDVAEWNGEIVALSAASGEILNLGPGGRPS